MDIASPHNAKLKLLRQLQQQRAARQAARAFVLEGARAIEAASSAGFVQWVMHTAHAAQQYPYLMQQITTLRIPTFLTTPELLASCSETEHTQGILALATMPDWARPVCWQSVLICDQLTDPGNLGTILRTAVAAGWQAVCLMPGTVDLYNPKVVRASLGAVLQLPTFSVTWDTLHDWLHGLPIWLAAATGAQSYHAVDWCQPSALIVSNEAHGASAAARQLATGSVCIPLATAQESLNVAVATGILLFEAARQWRAG